MALKWRWRQRREAAGLPADRPNLVMGINVQVVLGEVLPLLGRRAAPRARSRSGRLQLNAEEALKLVDENTIGVVAILGSTFDGSYEPVKEIAAALDELAGRGRARRAGACRRGLRRLRGPVHRPRAGVGLPGAAGAARSTPPGTSTGWSTRASAGCIWRDPEDLPEELVFHVELPGRGHADLRAELLPARRPGGRRSTTASSGWAARATGASSRPAATPPCTLSARIAALGPYELLVRRLRAAGVLLPARRPDVDAERTRSTTCREDARAGLAGARVHPAAEPSRTCPCCGSWSATASAGTWRRCWSRTFAGRSTTCEARSAAGARRRRSTTDGAAGRGGGDVGSRRRGAVGWVAIGCRRSRGRGEGWRTRGPSAAEPLGGGRDLSEGERRFHHRVGRLAGGLPAGQGGLDGRGQALELGLLALGLAARGTRA